MGEIVIVAYRPKPGQDAALAALVRDHVQTLHGFGLVTDRAPIIMRGADGAILEVFEWVEGGSARAHSVPEVLALWERFSAACTFATLREIPETAETFATFKPF